MSEENQQPIKQMLIIRKDLNMRKGKIAAQAAHASLGIFFNMMKENPVITNEDGSHTFTLKVDNPFMYNWMMGHFRKIVLYVESEQELFDIHQKAQNAGLPCILIRDAGFTEFDGPTYTAVGIGPDDFDKINPITKDLKTL